MNQVISGNRKYLNLIKIISIIIPFAVATLFILPSKMSLGEWVAYLPHLNAIINSITSILLVAALMSVLNKNIELHRNLMSVSFVLGSIFLVSYIIYHSSVPGVVFGDIDSNGSLDMDERNVLGFLRLFYLFFLLTHIMFSIVVVPFVLVTFYFSLTDQIARHKKIVKFTFPIWLYVSITGVIVYFMIRPYYQF